MNLENRKSKVYRFDIFKGSTTAEGKVQKICSVGHSTLFEGSATYCLYLKTLLKDQFFLLPEQQEGRPYDYVILTRELGTTTGKKYFWNRVGVARNMTDLNTGLLKLEFDLFPNVDIYLSYSDCLTREQDLLSNPAA